MAAQIGGMSVQAHAVGSRKRGCEMKQAKRPHLGKSAVFLFTILRFHRLGRVVVDVSYELLLRLG